MRVKIFVPAIVSLLFSSNSVKAQYAYGDNWYTNPLGFKPLNLHTSMGFIVPAVAAGTYLLLTNKDTTLRNKLSWYSEFGPSWGYKYPHTSLYTLNTGFNYRVRSHLSLGVESDLYFAGDKFNSATGFAIRPFARFYMISKPGFAFYFESGGGFAYFTDHFPKPTDQDARTGTRLNGTTKYGLGTEISISKRKSLLFGIRHVHISNGNTSGSERNPSHDSNGFFIGVSFGK